ncbi:MAG TPA: hypothetical protein VKS60_20420 [Stellaceae bacterium]|nr:hypothetical protein [Stellaceae bacterium]
MNWRLLTLAGAVAGSLLCAAPLAARADSSVTDIALGTGATADNEITGESTKFAPDTADIFCVLEFEGSDTVKAIRGMLIAVDVGAKAPPNFKVLEKTLDFNNDSGNAKFDFSKPNAGWPVGKYKVDVYLNDKLAKSAPFTVE